MRVANYQKVVRRTDQTNVGDGHSVRVFGLAGEIGSLLGELKKDIREGKASVGTADRVSEEIGDILWYVTALTIHSERSLGQDVLYRNLRKISDPSDVSYAKKDPRKKSSSKSAIEVANHLKSAEGKSVQSFRVYQDLAVKTSRFKHLSSLLPYIVRVWSHSAQLLETLAAEDHGSGYDQSSILTEVLGDVTWYLANIASAYELNLDDIATKNADKVLARWPGVSGKATPLFDRDAPKLEQFPRRFDVEIVPKKEHVSVMMINGILVGDPLTDNSWEPDGYRFHDTIHLAHAAILGWSPVLRRMLKRKRRYDKRIDEIEDGARAAIVEEAVAKLVHSYAHSVDRTKLLDDQSSVSFDILKQIKSLTTGLEVDQCKYWEWEKAILTGQKVFNELRRNRQGRIRVDLNNRLLSFRAY